MTLGPQRSPAPAVSLRPITPADHDLLRRVYAGTREAELALIDWDDAQKAAFIGMQFEAQRRHYHEHYADASFDMVLVGDRAAGPFYVARRPDQIRIVDIALLPELRGQGVGTRLVAGLLAEAAALASPVTLHVERNNRALGWYQRLGFVIAEDRGVHLFLRCQRALAPDRGGPE